MSNKKTAIVLFIFFLVLGTAFLGYYYKTTIAEKKVTLPVIEGDRNHHVHEFSFLNQDGVVVNNETVKGKVCVVEYFFATCKSICPKMNENMAKVYKAFRGNDRVVILSHTVDPDKDTVAALKAYSLKFEADAKQWMFLTGDKKKLYDMARYSYLISAQDDTTGIKVEDDFIHDNHYALVDGMGRVRGFYDGLEISQINKLITDINELLKEEIVTSK